MFIYGFWIIYGPLSPEALGYWSSEPVLKSSYDDTAYVTAVNTGSQLSKKGKSLDKC